MQGCNFLRDQQTICHLLNVHHCKVKVLERVPHVKLAISYANVSANHSIVGVYIEVSQQTSFTTERSNQSLKSGLEKCLLFINYDDF